MFVLIFVYLICTALAGSIPSADDYSMNLLEDKIKELETRNLFLKEKVATLEKDTPSQRQEVLRAFSAQPSATTAYSSGNIMAFDSDDLNVWGLTGSIFVCDTNGTANRGYYMFTMDTNSDMMVQSQLERTSSQMAYVHSDLASDSSGARYDGEASGSSTVIVSCDDYTNMWVSAHSNCGAGLCELKAQSRFSGFLLYT